jgi:hypothetical protein
MFHGISLMTARADFEQIRTFKPPVNNLVKVFGKLLRLDSNKNPGLTFRDFKLLFAKCRECNLVMTRRTFGNHMCEDVE